MARQHQEAQDQADQALQALAQAEATQASLRVELAARTTSSDDQAAVKQQAEDLSQRLHKLEAELQVGGLIPTAISSFPVQAYGSVECVP